MKGFAMVKNKLLMFPLIALTKRRREWRSRVEPESFRIWSSSLGHPCILTRISVDANCERRTVLYYFLVLQPIIRTMVYTTVGFCA